MPFLFLGAVAGSGLASAASQLPAFKVKRWVNSAPVTADALRGNGT